MNILSYLNAKYLLTLVLSLFFFALTYESAPTEFTRVDLSVLAFLLAGVLTVEFLTVHWFVRHRILQNLILAAFNAINILHLNLILNEEFAYLPVYGKVLCLLLAVFILFTFMNMLDENTLIAKVLPSIFALAAAGVFAQTIDTSTPAPVKPAEHRITNAKNIRIVDFKKKPNVYFIAFDSLIPKVILKKHLGLETTAYHEVLDANFRGFRNFFSNKELTKPSLNSTLALSIEHFEEAVANGTGYSFFTGLVPSPLLEIFKHNGYETTTHFKSFYLGTEKGPYVDNYNVPPSIFDTTFCNFVDAKDWKAFTLMGYCHFLKRPIIHKILKGSGIVNNNEMDALIAHMRAGLQKEKPQVFVAYIWSPGHTLSKSYSHKAVGDFENYKQQYNLHSKTTASHIKKVIAFITNEDPGAIVYIFGDHGPYISRRDTFEENRSFYVQDIFAVYGGIYPRDRCSKYFDELNGKDFVTVAQGAHMVIKCLSDGENAFLEPENYRLPEMIPREYNHYEDYLYE